MHETLHLQNNHRGRCWPRSQKRTQARGVEELPWSPETRDGAKLCAQGCGKPEPERCIITLTGGGRPG